MFTPMFHGQNRMSINIINPEDIPNYTNHTIWIDFDDSNIDTIAYDGYYLVDKIYNIAKSTEYFVTDESNLYRAKLIEDDSNFNDINSGLFGSGTIGRYGVSIGGKSDATPYDTGGYNEITAFFVLSYNTNNLETLSYRYNTIYYWLAENGRQYAIYMNYNKIGILRVDGGGLVNIGSFSHPNTGANKYILSINARSISINGVEKLNIYSSYPLSSTEQVDSDGLGTGIFYGQNITYLDVMSGYLAEAIIYGYKLTESNHLGVINWLNKKYDIF